MRVRLVVSFAACVTAASAWAGCVGDDPGSVSNDPTDASIDVPSTTETGTDGGADGATDGPADAAPTRCNRDAPFAPPTRLQWIGTPPPVDSWGRLSPDELTMYLNAAPPGGDGGTTVLSVTTRASITAPWPQPSPLVGDVNLVPASAPTVTGDGLTLFFVRGDIATARIHQATRATTSANFGDVKELAALLASTGGTALYSAYVLPAGDVLYFDSLKDPDGGGTRTFANHRASRAGGADFTMARPLPAGPYYGGSLIVTPDELSLYGAVGSAHDIALFRRADTNSPWTGKGVIPELKSADQTLATWIAPDDCAIYFWSLRDDGVTPHMYTAVKPK